MAEPLRSIPFDYEVDDEPLTAHEQSVLDAAAAKVRTVRLGGNLTVALGVFAVAVASTMFVASTRNLMQVGPGERWIALAGMGLVAVGGLIVVALGLIVRSMAELVDQTQ